jgi:hypothetical protein
MKTIALLSLGLAIPVSAACSSYATCPHDGEEAVLVATSMDSAGHCVGTYSHMHQQGFTRVQHTFVITR